MADQGNKIMINGWAETTVKDAAEFTSKPRGLDVKSVSQVPFIPMDLVPQNGTFIATHNWKTGKAIKSGNYFEKGDCLLSKITPCFENGKQGIANRLAAEFGYASTELIPFRGKDKISNKFFLHYFFSETTTRKQLAQKTEGATGRQRLPLSVLKSWPINLPPLPEQNKIAAVLLKIQQSITAQEKIIDSLQNLKRSNKNYWISGGKTKGALTCGALREYPLPLPRDLREQQEIADVLKHLDTKTTIAKSKIIALQSLFKTTLNKLMSGDIRVADLDIDVNEVDA